MLNLCTLQFQAHILYFMLNLCSCSPATWNLCKLTPCFRPSHRNLTNIPSCNTSLYCSDSSPMPCSIPISSIVLNPTFFILCQITVPEVLQLEMFVTWPNASGVTWPNASGQGTWPEAGQFTNISSCRTAGTVIWHKNKESRIQHNTWNWDWAGHGAGVWAIQTWITAWNVCKVPVTWPEALGQLTNIPSCRTAKTEIQHKINWNWKNRDLTWIKKLGLQLGML